jgi:hypothetical protein
VELAYLIRVILNKVKIQKKNGKKARRKFRFGIPE